MSGFTRFRRGPTLVLGLALLCIPTSLQAQTAEEKARQEEFQQRMEERAREQEFLLQQLEQRLVQAHAQAEHAQINQEEVLARQMKAQAEAMARMEEARKHYGEGAAEYRAQAEEARARYGQATAAYRVQAEEARAQAREQMRRARQVLVQVRSRVRLGVSLDGAQGAEVNRQGARIQSILEDTPAEEAGLLEGDIITHLNGHNLLDPISSEGEKELEEDGSLPVQRLMALAQDLEAGDEVEVRYLRDGQAQTVSFEAAEIDDPSITVLRGGMGDFEGLMRFDPEERGVWNLTFPDDGEFKVHFRDFEDLKELEELKIKLNNFQMDAPNIRFRSFPEGAIKGWAQGGEDAPFVYSMFGSSARFGLELTELNPGLSEYFSSDEGLLVLDVDEDSTLGLSPGDVILAIDGRTVEDRGDVRRILASYVDEETVSFTVVRKGREITVEGAIR